MLNTVIALLGAVLAAFTASAACGKLDMVHIQNATLAGGVAIGSSANLAMPPACALAGGCAWAQLAASGCVAAGRGAVWGCMLDTLMSGKWRRAAISARSTALASLDAHSPPLGHPLPAPRAVGIAAGAFSTAGYLLLSPWLEGRCGLTDTCGVANLHGMPGVLGGLASALFAWLFFSANDALMERGAAQPLVQLAGLGATLAAAAVGGLAAGWVVTKVNLSGQEGPKEDDLFDDAVFWHEVEKEE